MVKLPTRFHEEPILKELEKPLLFPDSLRFLWVLELLEQKATPEARAFLLELGQGTPEAWLNLEAIDSLKRLDEGKKPGLKK